MVFFSDRNRTDRQYVYALDNDEDVYETEVMEMFTIDSNTMTIEEWFPNL